MAAITTTDERGRLNLGKKFGKKLFLVKQLAGGIIQIVPAEAVPAREAWLYKNPKALAAVLEGLEQAKAGNLVDGPDLEGAEAFVDASGDD